MEVTWICVSSTIKDFLLYLYCSIQKHMSEKENQKVSFFIQTLSTNQNSYYFRFPILHFLTVFTFLLSLMFKSCEIIVPPNVLYLYHHTITLRVGIVLYHLSLSSVLWIWIHTLFHFIPSPWALNYTQFKLCKMYLSGNCLFRIFSFFVSHEAYYRFFILYSDVP